MYNKNHYLLHILTSVVIITAPYVNVLFLVRPSHLFGKNAFLFLQLAVVMVVAIALAMSRKGRLHFAVVPALGLLTTTMIVWAFRKIIYVENISLMTLRFFFFWAFAYCFMRLISSRSNPELILVSLVVQGIMVTLTVIANNIFFPGLNVIDGPDGIPVLIYDGERQRGGILGASIAANFLIVSMFSLYFLKKGSFLGKMRPLLMATFMLGVYLNQSRFPIVIMALIGLHYFFISKNKGLMETAGRVSIFAAAIFTFINYLNYISDILLIDNVLKRFSSDGGGRLDKILLGFDVWMENFSSFMFGNSLDKVAQIVNGIQISDNSFILIATQLGFISLGVFIAALWGIFKTARGPVLVFAAYFLLNLNVSNVILWDGYVLSFFAAYAAFAKIYEIRNFRFERTEQIQGFRGGKALGRAF